MPVINYSLGGASSLGATLHDAFARAVDASTILVLAASSARTTPSLPIGRENYRFIRYPVISGRLIPLGLQEESPKKAGQTTPPSLTCGLGL